MLALEAHERSIEMRAKADAQILDLLRTADDETDEEHDIQVALKRLSEIQIDPKTLVRGKALAKVLSKLERE